MVGSAAWRRQALFWLVAGVLFAGGSLPAGATLYKEFRDWTVSCSNGLTCSIGYSDYDNSGINTIALSRSNAPHAPVVVEFPFPPGFDKGGDPAGRYDLAVDGQTVLEASVGRLEANPDAQLLRFVDEAALATLVEAMKGGTRMQVIYRGGLGRFTLDAPLSGVTASLLYVDEAQDRLKRVDALHDKGDRPAPESAPIRDLASYDDLPADIRALFTNPDAECGSLDPGRFPSFGAFEAVFDGGARLIGMPCGTGGAYNQPFVLFSTWGADDKSFDPVPLPFMSADGPKAEISAFNIDFDVRTRALTAFYKGRGLGDCGTYTKWQIPDLAAGISFLLVEQRSKEECDGLDGGEIDMWPLVWPRR